MGSREGHDDAHKGRWLRKIRDVGKGTVIQLQYGNVAIEDYLLYERVVFVLEIFFRFRLLQLYL
jgi:hypothetical protein